MRLKPHRNLSLLTSLTFVLVFASGRSSSAVGRFWHITDLHWDPSYTLTDPPNNVCASNGNQPAPKAGKFGDYSCDSPWDLIQSSVNAMKVILPDPDFIIWTGDDTPHVPNEKLGEEAVLSIVSNLTHLLQRTFPKTKVYSALGNHDYHPKNQLPPEPNTIYNRTAQLWRNWLERDSQLTIQRGGFYTERLLNRTGYRILVLNTNLYYDQNTKTEKVLDPAGQFAWMDDILGSAAKKQEKVYIVGHVPPGFFEKKRGKAWFRSNYNSRYLQLIQKHHAVISGQFFGHHHTDSFRMFYDSKGSPISAMFLTPGVTPWKTTLPGVRDGANNPAIRVFEYDTSTLLVKDMVTYYLNLSFANAALERWEKEYRLCESFQVPDASPSSMDRVQERLASSACDLQRYYELNSVSYDLSACDLGCRADHVCAIREVDFARYESCLTTEGAAGSTRLGLAPLFLSLALGVYGSAH